MFSRLQDYMTPQLQKMLSPPTAPIEEVLLLPYIAQSARVGFPQLIDYFSAHYKDLLKYAFSLPTPDVNPNLSKHAYTILLMGDPKILLPMLKDFSFRDVATELLSQNDLKPILIGRLSSITQACLANLSQQATDSCGFIYRLLTYCGNPSVFNFFVTICGEDERFIPAQHWLNDMGFSLFVFREFDKIDVNYKPEDVTGIWKDPIFIRYLCLYQLITKCCQNEILQKGFRTIELVKLLKKEFVNSPDYLNSAKWSAITAATCQDIAVPLLDVIPHALKVLTEPFEKLKSFRVSALEFITQMMKLAPMTYSLLLESSMPQMLINLVFAFPNSTILHMAFLQFVETGLTHESFAMKIVSVYAPVCIDCAIQGTNRVLIPTCMKMMTLFNEAAKKEKNLALALYETPEYNNFVKKNLKEYTTLISRPYGDDGPVALFKKVKSIFNS